MTLIVSSVVKDSPEYDSNSKQVLLLGGQSRDLRSDNRNEKIYYSISLVQVRPPIKSVSHQN